MKQIVLDVEEGRYALFLQFLKTLNYVHVVPPRSAQKGKGKSTSPKNGKPHFLADLVGIMDDESGAELAEIVNREFQQIEGEW